MQDNIIRVRDRFFRRFLSRQAIDERVASLGEKIRCDYNDKNIVYVIVLKGAMMFAMDLIRSASVSCEIEVVGASSYGNAMNSSGTVSFSFPSTLTSLHDRDVIIVEDIVDTGRTITELQRELLKYSPRSVRVATLLLKSEIYAADMPIDYVGFDIAPAFVIGYGMDYAEAGRYLSDIYVVHEAEHPAGV